MSIRTTVTLDEDVLMRVKDECRIHGSSFRATLNNLVRSGLSKTSGDSPKRTLKITPTAMSPRAGLNMDDIGGLLEYAESELHR